MTRKDYILIAKAIADTDIWLADNFEKNDNTEDEFYRPRVYRGKLLNRLTENLKADNPNFDALKFYKFINKLVN